MSEAEARLSTLPAEHQQRLKDFSLPELLDRIEACGWENEAGKLANFVEWLELRARADRLCRILPKPTS